MEVNNILFVRNRGFGDILMTTVAVRRLRKKYPNIQKLTYACDPDMIEVLRYNPYIDEIITVAQSKQIKHPNLLTINLLWKVEDYRIENGANKKNRLDRFLELCNVTNVDDDYHLDYYITTEEDLWAKEYLLKINNNPIVGLCVQASAPYRTWNEEKFHLLIEKLSILNFNIILFGKFPFKEQILGDNIYNTSGKLTIRQTSALMKQCKVVVSGDTGDSHLCGALDIPNIILYGALPPESRCKYYPYAIPMYKNLVCTPCWDGQFIHDNKLFVKNCRTKNPMCLQEITVDEVYSTILDSVNGTLIRQPIVVEEKSILNNKPIITKKPTVRRIGSRLVRSC